MEFTFFWFRRDLRLSDNTALFHALSENKQVVPLFIFDTDIIDELPKNDARISFIYQQLEQINVELKKIGSSLLVLKGKPKDVWQQLFTEHPVKNIYFNKDYEPYAITRDKEITTLAKTNNIAVFSFKDQVIFEENDVLKDDKTPYTIYTPYKNKWLKAFSSTLCEVKKSKSHLTNLSKIQFSFPSLASLNLNLSSIKVKSYSLASLENYEAERNFPATDNTSYLSPHLRFGTVSIREIVKNSLEKSPVFLSELIWREFFMQILFHFPHVVNKSFKAKYDNINWRNNKKEFALWCEGKTGYPIVDAGMRQLNETGYMHNRVRMVVASFLCKHLLIDWRWGEAYFAKKLLDYDLSANNGNWQWTAGTGCDAAPYFRVFNPYEQVKKFDPDLKYITKWVKTLNELTYPAPIVEHKFARERAIATYKKGLEKA
ncbi:MAG: deoxyribodipyrimidine photo-lyase [Flavobacteriales bacterium]|jgi:deoxyribodipyrimidine photo-lyase|nr:deoxyribodipyrimidine photo-lyase [Flavobacteriales bacterium]